MNAIVSYQSDLARAYSPPEVSCVVICCRIVSAFTYITAGVAHAVHKLRKNEMCEPRYCEVKYQKKCTKTCGEENNGVRFSIDVHTTLTMWAILAKVLVYSKAHRKELSVFMNDLVILALELPTQFKKYGEWSWKKCCPSCTTFYQTWKR